MPEIEVIAMIWRILTSATLKAAVHLCQDFSDNLRTTKNTDFEKVGQVFDISQKLILNQSEDIFGVSTIDRMEYDSMGTTLLPDRAVKMSKAKVHSFSDAASCTLEMLLHRWSLHSLVQ